VTEFNLKSRHNQCNTLNERIGHRPVHDSMPVGSFVGHVIRAAVTSRDRSQFARFTDISVSVAFDISRWNEVVFRPVHGLEKRSFVVLMAFKSVV
jgi:hypothetical protein